MVKGTMPSILNIVRNIFMSLYGSVEEVVTVCIVYKSVKYGGSPPPLDFFPGFGFRACTLEVIHS